MIKINNKKIFCAKPIYNITENIDKFETRHWGNGNTGFTVNKIYFSHFLFLLLPQLCEWQVSDGRPTTFQSLGYLWSFLFVYFQVFFSFCCTVCHPSQTCFHVYFASVQTTRLLMFPTLENLTVKISGNFWSF